MHTLNEWLSSNGLMPHGFCYQWNPALIWLHVICDALIAISYFSIPAALIYLTRKRRDIPFGWMFLCFSAFIAACGLTHAMDIWTLWVPAYWLSGGVKLGTALLSVPTAVFLVRLMPTALSLPNMEKVRLANEQLRKQAESLRKSEERFRQMAENIQEIFWMMDPNTKEISYVSPAFEQICESPLESLLVDPWSYRGLMHPEDRARVLAALENLASSNRFEEEFRIVCPTGVVKWVRAIGFTSKDSAGNVSALVGTVQEITIRKEMETVLRESEDRYRDLVENSTDLICTYDLQGRLLSVNELPSKLLGYSPEELLNKPMREFLLPEVRAQFDESLSAIRKNGFVKGSMVVLTKTGERRIWEFHNTLRTEGVTAPIVRGVAHDVTEQKRLERALRLSEEKFAKAFQSSPVEIVIKTIEEGRYIEVNKAFERNTGFTRAESIGRTSVELGLWDNPADRAEVIDQMKKTGRLQEVEIRSRNKSGELRLMRYSAEPIQIAGEPCMLAVCEDITESKEAEVALRQERDRAQHYLDIADVILLGLDLNGRVTLINRKGCTTLGWQEHEMLGSEWIETCLPPRTREAFKNKFQKLVCGDISCVENQVLTNTGEERLIRWRNSLLRDERGFVIGTLSSGEDITERNRVEMELQRLSGQLLRLQDEERRRIARDLHDSTGQNLIALATTLDQLDRAIPPNSRKVRSLCLQCQEQIEQCTREIRTLSYLLHPPLLDETGLADAIRQFADGFTKRSGIRVNVTVSPSFGRMPSDVELSLFKVVQESLTNVQRHSGSSQVTIKLDRRSKDTRIEVTDTGRIGAGKRRGRNGAIPFEVGVGIPSMQERVKLIGGFFEMDCGAHGTAVRVTIPVTEWRT
ncbi:MAG TPA: PAS domain S-box protein [Candidatus Acidoferrum sp.]|nr:PAS domain S-box protein [Candidatus Acidoferrum sp.]